MARIVRAAVFRHSFFLEEGLDGTPLRFWVLTLLDSDFVVISFLCHNEQRFLILTERTDFLGSIGIYLPLCVSAVSHALLVKQFREKSSKNAVSDELNIELTLPSLPLPLHQCHHLRWRSQQPQRLRDRS